jgi:hypothetical protein
MGGTAKRLVASACRVETQWRRKQCEDGSLTVDLEDGHFVQNKPKIDRREILRSLGEAGQTQIRILWLSQENLQDGDVGWGDAADAGGLS